MLTRIAAPVLGPNLLACLRMGMAYAEGRGTKRDNAKAKTVFNALCKAGIDVGCTLEIEGGSTDMIAVIKDACVAPENAFLPEAIS